MNKLLSDYKSDGFDILAYPCNQFMFQEPRSESAIQKFCSNLGFTGSLFEKINVNGSSSAPVYKWLKTVFPGDITWNFASKFIINRQGIPVARFDSKVGWKEISQFIGEELKK